MSTSSQSAHGGVNSQIDSFRQVDQATLSSSTVTRLESLSSRMAQHQSRLDTQKAVLVGEKLAMQQHAESRMGQCFESKLAPLEAHRSALCRMQEAVKALLLQAQNHQGKSDERRMLSLVGN